MQLKNKKRGRIVSLVFAGVLICLISGVALASYIQTALLGGYTAAAADFYFTSDLLRDGADAPVYDLYHDWQAEGAATIRVKLKNYEDALNVTQGDIAYTVEATAAGGSVAGVLSSGAREETVALSVPRPADPNLPLEVTVTAKSAAPYTKTLRGRFVIRPALSYTMDANAGEPVAELVVTLAPGAGADKTVAISWPAGAAPDMTNPIVTGAESLDLENRTLTTVLPTASVSRLAFFKDSAGGEYAGVTVSGT